MRPGENPALRARLHDALVAVADYYPDLETCTWGFAEDEREIQAVIEFVGEYPEATTSDVIRFRLWFQDQREDGKL